MTAPLALDTTREDWRRQFRGITTCKGPTCGARIGWMIHIEDGKERRVPYNSEDGRIHHSTCLDIALFKLQREAKKKADVIKNKAPQVGESAKPPILTPPAPERTKPQQGSLFGVNLNTQTNYPD